VNLQSSGLAEAIRTCDKCSARKDARCPVSGEGPEEAQIIFIGRNPGENEDQQNRPFVGRAGKLLGEIIEALSLERENCGVLNTVKCFTSKNRAPTPDEISSCSLWLQKELQFFSRKKILIPLGSEAFKGLFTKNDLKISAAVGKVFKPNGSMIITIPLYHPAYLLRNPSEKTKMFNYTLPRVFNYLKENISSLFEG